MTLVRRVSPFAILLGTVALMLTAADAPAEAGKKRSPAEKAAEELISDPANGEPLTIVVSLSDQKSDLYRGMTLIGSSKVSSGMPGYATKPGVFSILQKQRYHHSNMYSGAPMPWMQRLTRSGTALHAGVVPGYPASHGCIRLPFSFAPKLFQITSVGDHVLVASDRVVPKLIEHPTLFQPSMPPQPDETTVPVVVDTQGSSTEDAQKEPAAGAEMNITAAELLGSASREGTSKPSLDGPNSSSVAELGSSAPLRILVTRRTQRDRIIGVQYLLSSLGYLRTQKFYGRIGNETVAAIKTLQKANGLPTTGAFTDNLEIKIHQVAGKEEPPDGHLFVRQDFHHLFDAPIEFRNPHETLGTHVFVALRFAPGDAKTQWMAISLEGDNATSILDRIDIPDALRQKVSQRLTPGSSLIIADRSIDSAILPDGDDFLIWAKETPVMAEANQVTSKRRPRVQTVRAGTLVEQNLGVQNGRRGQGFFGHLFSRR